MSEVRGSSREELPHVRGQGSLGGDTPQTRSESVTLRSHLQARGRSWEEPPTRGQSLWRGGASLGVVAAQAQEGLEDLSHVEGQEQQR